MDPSSLQDLLQRYTVKQDGKYISQEFQDYAYRLALDLKGTPDKKTIGMCMRLVKTKPRGLLEKAQGFVKDANAHNKVGLFLWKLKQLEEELKKNTKIAEELEVPAETLFPL